MKLTKELADHVAAAFSGLWVQTWEPEEAEAEIRALCHEQGWNVASWDLVQGIRGLLNSGKGDPLYPLVTTKAEGATNVALLHNYHRYLANPQVVQALANAVHKGKRERLIYVVLAPVVQLPPELEKIFVVLEHELPDESTLHAIGLDLLEGGPPINGLVEASRAAAGLTRFEAEGAYSLSLARHQRIRADEVWSLKTKTLKKSGLLELYRGTERFETIGGLDAAKDFIKKSILSSSKVRPRGVLLLGVSGTGKSALAKASGGEVNQPVLMGDPGNWMGHLMGESQQKIRMAFKQADAQAPVILFCDEIEKALAGSTSSHQGDSGVGADQLRTLLTWLNDHTSAVYPIFTANDISKLPMELTRAERFDAIFFMDLPGRDEKDRIWNIWLHHPEFQLTAPGPLPDDTDWTGAEIRACCRLASLHQAELLDVAKYVIPVARSSAEKVLALREQASGRWTDANTGEVYQLNRPKQAKVRRVVHAVK